MDFNNASITFHTTSVDVPPLDKVYAHYSPGERSLYTGADGSETIINRAGWLAIKTDEFKGWLDVYAIEVTIPDGPTSTRLFEVTRNFNTPMVEDGHMWFPVMHRQASVYSG